MKHLLVCAACTATFVTILSAQTLVEHSMITAGSTMGAAGMSGVGKAAAKLLENAGNSLEQAGATGRSSVVTIPRLDDKQPKPNGRIPDAKAIQAGMTADQLTSKFGPPAMKVNGANSETWIYGSAPEELAIELKEGKVGSVTVPKKQNGVSETSKSTAPLEKADTAVVVIQ